jgi:hypothetical protein
VSENWKEMLGFDPETESGWIPLEQRPLGAAEELDAVPGFDELNGYGDDPLPKEALIPKLEIKLFGSVLPFIWQITGSCVGAGWAKADLNAQVGDVAVRNDHEEVKMCYPWATYGVGREMAGMRGTGSGSWGTAQARAGKEWGKLPGDDSKYPQPSNSNGWLKWSSSTELTWSHPRAWPISKTELTTEANKFSNETAARVKTTDELAKAAAQAYGITLASNFGTRSPQVKDGFLIAKWNGSWAHQMSCSGYTTHPSLGRIWWIQNQWGPGAHPKCPYMSPLGVNGGFWIEDSTMQKICASEVFVHSNTKGFPKRVIPWGTMGIV